MPKRFEMPVIVSFSQKKGLSSDALCKAIRDLRDQSDALRQSMSDWRRRDAVAEILSILADCLNKN